MSYIKYNKVIVNCVGQYFQLVIRIQTRMNADDDNDDDIIDTSIL
jgi:hypothetical protein